MAVNTVAEAAQELAAAAKVEAQADVAAIVADAAASVEHAQEVAQTIVEAAAAAPLAQAVAELQQENEEAEEWENQVERQLAALELRVSELSNKLEALMAEPKPTVTITAPAPGTETAASSILPTSLEPEMVTVTVEPEAVKVENAGEVVPVAVPPGKRRTRML